MATKQELIDKIQTIAKRVYTAKIKDNTLGITPDDVNFDKETFPILSKFSTLKQIIINLLTDQYELFISDIGIAYIVSLFSSLEIRFSFFLKLFQIPILKSYFYQENIIYLAYK